MKGLVKVESAAQARDLLATMRALTGSEAWALFVQMAEAAYSDAAFAGQITTISTADGPIDRKVAELVGQRKAALYLLSLPTRVISECQKVIGDDDVATEG